MGLIIDSSIFVELERRRVQPAVTLANSYEEPTAVAAITASELLVGVHRADSIERRMRREAFVESVSHSMTVIPFDLAVARMHAQIWAQLAVKGTPIGERDLQIAATAITLGHAVLTFNTREFLRVT